MIIVGCRDEALRAQSTRLRPCIFVKAFFCPDVSTKNQEEKRHGHRFLINLASMSHKTSQLRESSASVLASETHVALANHRTIARKSIVVTCGSAAEGLAEANIEGQGEAAFMSPIVIWTWLPRDVVEQSHSLQRQDALEHVFGLLEAI
jgi:hypothetical protein